MDKTYKVRIHMGRMETKYGVDVATLVDDPVQSQMTVDEVESKLMGYLNYKPKDENDDDLDYPGTYDDRGAYFDYDGYIDVDIPQSIVKRILDNK